MEYLKPTTDLVFKLLLLQDKELVLLRSMLECVLEPPSPITAIETLNPEVEKDYPATRPLRLTCVPSSRISPASISKCRLRYAHDQRLDSSSTGLGSLVSV